MIQGEPRCGGRTQRPRGAPTLAEGHASSGSRLGLIPLRLTVIRRSPETPRFTVSAVGPADPDVRLPSGCQPGVGSATPMRVSRTHVLANETPRSVAASLRSARWRYLHAPQMSSGFPGEPASATSSRGRIAPGRESPAPCSLENSPLEYAVSRSRLPVAVEVGPGQDQVSRLRQRELQDSSFRQPHPRGSSRTIGIVRPFASSAKNP